MKIITFLPLLAALALGGCGVVSRKPVGGKVAQLKPEVWNARWESEEGGILETQIKDARLGIVEFRTIHKPKGAGTDEGPDTSSMLARVLGDEVILNAKTDNPDGYMFFRVSIDASHLVLFGSQSATFIAPIEHHKLAGTVEKDKKGKPTGNCTLEGLSDRDLRRLKGEGIDPQMLFDEDPVMVLIRAKWHPFWYFF